MKITPMTGAPTVDVGAVSTARGNPDRIAAAKAIAMGETPMRLVPSETPVDPQVQRLKRTIQMTTQATPDAALVENAEKGIISPIDEQTPEVEATKPLSPQFAALAKQKRALQQERANLEREKAELQAAKAGQPHALDIARLKEDPLSILDEAGVLDDKFYNSLTDRLINGQANPAAAQIAALKAEIEALKTGVDQKLTERDTQAETQVVNEIKREAKTLVSQGDQYKYTRFYNAADDAARLIHENWKATGEVWDTTHALNLIEAEYQKKYEASAKVAGLLEAQAAQAQAQQAQPQMRTLTNRDTARPGMSRRERMIAAFYGAKK